MNWKELVYNGIFAIGLLTTIIAISIAIFGGKADIEIYNPFRFFK